MYCTVHYTPNGKCLYHITQFTAVSPHTTALTPQEQPMSTENWLTTFSIFSDYRRMIFFSEASISDMTRKKKHV